MQPLSTVTVVAPPPGYRSTIDRRSYSLADDLQKSAGSLADVLSHVPAVQVDVEGNISLRGDADVTILVDGKPSALFSGPGRAQAIQSMSADQFERVEVMTNPSAAQTAEGSGGIINLISKAPPKGGAAPTASGTVKASFGTGDRFDLGVNGVYSGHGLSLTGGADLRRSGFQRDIDSRYQLPSTGGFVPADGVQFQRSHDDTLTLYGSVGYDLDPHDHLDLGLNAIDDRPTQNQLSTYQTGASAGPVALAYLAPGGWRGEFTSVSESLGLSHALPGDGQSLSLKLEVSQSRYTSRGDATYTYETPVQPDLYQSLVQSATFPQLDLKLDYKTVLPNTAKLALGYEGKIDWQSNSNGGIQGVSPALATTDPVFAQTFTFEQQVQAVYTTYEQVFGKLTVQPGLRLESATIDTDLASTAQKGHQTYFEAYPSLHLNYELDDASQIKASYGRRAQRPNGGQLDSFRAESTPTLYYAGNPDLRPAITQSYELGYEYRRKTTDLQATLFYRDKSDLLTQVTQDIGGDVLLSTWQNLGHGHDLGLELVANRDLTRTLSLNASTDILRSDVAATNLGILGQRSAVIVSGRATLNWQATPQDYIQLSGENTGRQLTAQGYRGGAFFSDLGWRHIFDSRLAAVITVQNPFGLSRRTQVIDTPDLVEVDKRKFHITALFLGLTYALGAAPKRAPDTFDFGAKNPGGQ